MENSANPLIQIKTSKGDVFVELFPDEAPDNVTQFRALAAGEMVLVDENTDTAYTPRYYNGMSFHRVIPDFLIQAGSPHRNPLGGPARLLDDEINADALGLGDKLVLTPDGSTNALLNLVTKDDFANQVLTPLYREMNITSAEDVIARQDQIAERLKTLTVKELYEFQGYKYVTNGPSHEVIRGTVALANTGPDSNGPEFFISLRDNPQLSGKHTVIGKVLEGMDIVDTIGQTPMAPTATSRISTIIYSVEEVNRGPAL